MDMYNNLLISFFCINKTNFKYYCIGVYFVPLGVVARRSRDVNRGRALWLTRQDRRSTPAPRYPHRLSNNRQLGRNFNGI